ncbi:MAG: sigma-70 family RNA polymerase sigma factor [Armatimonadota bacterium]|nr:sigma-70 family RNA polymerase sigma factor [Armatimonadota bacterium]
MEGVLITERACSDVQLARDAAAGDSSAFDALILQHHARIFRLALRMLGNREDAEDVQQETFVQAYRKLSMFRGESSFGSWLYAIAARICISRLRRTSRKPREAPIDPELIATIGSPEDSLLAADSARRVRQALSSLSPPDRLLITLKYIEGLGHEEIADVLKCSVQSSRSRLLRAKKLFREKYERM